MLTAARSFPGPSPVRSLLQASVACLAALAGGVFAAAEGGPLAAATIPIALCGLLWTDYQQSFSLHPWVANGLGLLAFVAAGFEFFGESIEGRLLGFGHLLCYLSWILLLQKKETPQFWWICAMSILQVATSSVLTNSLWLGFSLILYVLLALWTLSIFSLDRAVQRITRSESTKQAADRRRDARVGDTSAGRNAVKTENATGLITPRFTFGVIANGLLSIVVGLGFFLFTPRVWLGGNGTLDVRTPATVRQSTGFSEEVSVGDMGESLENHDLVLEVTITDDSTGAIWDVEEYAARLGDDAPHFRGVVLGTYANGRWSSRNSVRSVHRNPRKPAVSETPLVKQVIRLHPIGTNTLFTSGTTVVCRPADLSGGYAIEIERRTSTFRRIENSSEPPDDSQPFDYHVYSFADRRPTVSQLDEDLQIPYLKRMLYVPNRLGTLKRLAKRVVQRESETPPSSAEAVDRLVSLLRDSREYGYTADLSIDDPTIDPVVDFLINRKQGHCEYFASALTLMLRSVGIPARYVNGFKGGKLNEDTGKFEVRQLHAHAWVEAFVDGQWRTLDPTPAARDQAVDAISESSHLWTDLVSHVRNLWTMGMTMSGDQQQNLLLKPFEKPTKGLVDSLETIGSAFTERGTEAGQSNSTAQMIVMRLVAGLAGVAILFVGMTWLVKGGKARLRRRGKAGRSRHQRNVPTVAFYERFLAILAKQGHQRGDSQTPREFVRSLRQQLPSIGSANGESLIPESLTTAFYQVRFGEQTLPSAKLDDLNASLDQFERSLQNGRSRD